ncbi:MAG TPA: LLM class flavin-dependent oxidoreductase [Mycobacteriales bacterium]|nr:LLM class flavin-dependent oxidoreductase [Mycobacteriales bacterium]
MQHALFVPPFDELADPRVVARLAAEAEEHGWNGFFVWDHVAYRPPAQALADPWVVLSAVATATERLLIGPMVTPLPRRRPVKVARETASLDLLSGGRLVLGVGLGGDGSRELSATGEQTDDRVRAAMLDEALTVLAGAWSGEPVHHAGQHYAVDGLRFLPRPVQRPGPPVWVAMRHGNRAPLRRAARHDGVFPIELDSPDQLAELVADVTGMRGGAPGPFDVAVGGPPGTDARPFAAAGATWWTVSFPVGTTAGQVRGVLRDGPPG